MNDSPIVSLQEPFPAMVLDYRRLFHRLRRWRGMLERYVEYTPADWMKMGKEDRVKWFDRVHSTTRTCQDELASLEAECKRLRRLRRTDTYEEDLQRIREKIRVLLQDVNMHLGTLAHVMI